MSHARHLHVYMRHDWLAVLPLPVEVRQRIFLFLRHPAIADGVPPHRPVRGQFCHRCGDATLGRCTYRRPGTSVFLCAECGDRMCPAIVAVGPACLHEGACRCRPGRVLWL